MNPCIRNDRARIGATNRNRDRQGAAQPHHGRRWIAHRHLASLVAVLWASVAFGQVYRPEVPIALVAHQGGPVPGIAGATFTSFAPPQIDADGNVLLRASMSGPGIDSTNDVAIWFGQPGAIQMVARDGDRVPDMPSGVIYTNVGFWAVVSETGWIAFTAYVSGPGITEGVERCGRVLRPAGGLSQGTTDGRSGPGLLAGRGGLRFRFAVVGRGIDR